MKMCKKLLTSVVAFAMLFTLLVGNVCAAESKRPYTYTVTFSAGNQGTFSEESLAYVTKSDGASASLVDGKIVVTGLNAGSDVGLNNVQDAVKLNEGAEKYYAKGVRFSGRDNEDAPEFKVYRDMDYVVAYGIRGSNTTRYTVHYRYIDGKELAPSETFEGNVGDRPVVCYKYIAGYTPKVVAYTQRLETDAAENVFIFEYEKAPSNTYKEVIVEGEGGTSVDYVEQIITVPGGTAVTGGATNVTGGGAGAGEDDANAAGGAGDEAAGGEGGSDVIVDLDDEETPLANIDADGDSKMALPLAGYVAMGAAGIAALIAIIILILKNKAKKETNNE